MAAGFLVCLLAVSASLPPLGNACSTGDRETNAPLHPGVRSPWEERMVFDADVPRGEPLRIEFLPEEPAEDRNNCSDDGEGCWPMGQNAADALIFSDVLEYVLIGPSEDPGEAALHHLIETSSDQADWYALSDHGLAENAAVVGLYPWSHDAASGLPDRDEAKPNGRELTATVFIFGVRRFNYAATGDPNFYYSAPYALTPERYRELLAAEP
jgi:hypothetical protein